MFHNYNMDNCSTTFILFDSNMLMNNGNEENSYLSATELSQVVTNETEIIKRSITVPQNKEFKMKCYGTNETAR